MSDISLSRYPSLNKEFKAVVPAFDVFVKNGNSITELKGN